MARQEFESFGEFWPFYVAEHSRPATRALHVVGTSVGLACAAALLAKGKWRWLPLAFVPAYAAAWASHFFIERNRPATFEHPLWSLMGDYKMVGLMLAGRMDREVARAVKLLKPRGAFELSELEREAEAAE
ncbi:MAG TPA: DUF962 domain-containing protein [Pyrinomonadaceae bacterium]|jgi:hypothetical protein